MSEPAKKTVPEITELRAKLRKPLPDAAIKPHPTKNFLSVVNTAYVVERLNDCFGESGWRATYPIIENAQTSKMIVVRCEFSAPAFDIYREAFGGNDNPDRGDAYKGACSDALGKVASQLGIASDVYKGMRDSANGNGKSEVEQVRRKAPTAQPAKPADKRTEFSHGNNVTRGTKADTISPTDVFPKKHAKEDRGIEDFML